MARVLVLYASNHGQTRAIAEAIGIRLRQRDHLVELADANAGGAPPPLDYAAVVIGSRIQWGRHARSVVRYIERNRVELAELPTAFFSVSMSASSPEADPHGYLETFFRDTAWRPHRTVAFAGGLPYRQYNPVLRLVMRIISRVAGHPTDTSRNHVCTDWDRVSRFADDFAADIVDTLAADRVADRVAQIAATVRAPTLPPPKAADERN